MKRRLSILAALICVLLLSAQARALPTSPEVLELAAFVHDAAALLHIDGEHAFATFNTPDSAWYRGERYLFVIRADGVEVANPAMPELVGKNVMDLEDSQGRMVVREFFRDVMASPQHTAWVHYTWPNPTTGQEEWKTAYLELTTAPDGTKYIVGSGIYAPRVEDAFVEEAVHDMADLFARHGLSAIDRLGDPDGFFAFMGTFVFVYDTAGVELANPAQPELVGQNLLRSDDVNLARQVAANLDYVSTHGAGWIEGQWIDPETGEVTPTRSYHLPLEMNGRTYILGCGYYLR